MVSPSTQTALDKAELLPSVTDNISQTGAQRSIEGLVSDHFLWLFQWICYAVVCQVLGVFGTVTNIINIVCLAKQGFSDPVNVSFLGLAISDLGCLLTILWLDVGLTPVFQEADLPFVAVEIDYLTGGWPHVAFTRITSCITALITLERCLCVTVPLKIKRIFTSKRVAAIIACVFVVLICSISPIYCVNSFAWKFYPNTNKTMLGLVYSENRELVEKVSFALNNVFVPFLAFMIIVISTLTLVVKLHRKTKWRAQATGANQSESLSSRDQKVAKMVVIISTLFIVCFIPVCIIFVAMTLDVELAVDGRYKNMFLLVSGVAFTLESTNSSMNIFIYYHMSSKYRATFRQLFCSESRKGLC